MEIFATQKFGRMAKLADAQALGACGETLGGSNPLPPRFLVVEEDLKGAEAPCR